MPDDATIVLPEVTVHPGGADAMTAGTTGNQPGVSFTPGPVIPPDKLSPISSDLRSTYADALVGGTTLGPQHFQDVWNLAHQAAGEAASTHFAARADIAPQLPDNETVTDHALALLHDNNLPPTSDLVATTKANLLDHWADTGTPLPDIYTRALNDASFSDSLTRQQAPAPEPDLTVMTPQGAVFDPMQAPGVAKALYHGVSEVADFVKREQEETDRQEKAAYDAWVAGGRVGLSPKMQHNMDIAMSFGPGGIEKVGAAIAEHFMTAAQLAVRTESQAAGAAARATIRQARGRDEREQFAVGAALEKFRSVVNKHLPDFDRWLKSGADLANLPVVMHLINHIEGLAGAKLAEDSPLLPVANALRDAVKSVRGRIETELPDHRGFFEDYFRHLWEKPNQADRVFGKQRGGSNASLKQRTLPTLLDGIARGLRPRILDPIENTLHYLVGMRNYLTQHEVFRIGEADGHIQFSAQGIPHEGWKPLKGRFAERGGQQAYAPAGYAGAYNSWVGKGFHEWPLLGRIYDK
ncbi:MAG: hypothetical protein WB679_14240, partial [Terracidiphilus sp.]